MKNFKIIFLIVAAGLFITSCEKDKEGPFLNESTAAPQITAPTTGQVFVLTEAIETQDLATFTWSVPDYGFTAAPIYMLQIDKAGNNFANATNIATTSKPEYKTKVADFNMKILLFGGIPEEEGTYEMRVKATLTDSLPALVSSAITLKVTPFEKVIFYPMLFAPGAHNGWNEKDSASAIYSVKDDGVYEGWLNFTSATTEFKILKVPAWEEANTIGDPVASGQSGTLQIGSWGGNNIKIDAGIGYYRFKADLNGKTYSYTKVNSWGIIGPAQAGGWDSDTDLIYDPVTDTWTVTLNLTASEMKFRADNAWTLNYGDDGADRKLEVNGANIAVPTAGNYTVTLDLSGAVYKYKMVKN